MTKTNAIIDIALDAFDAFALANDPTSPPIAIRDMTTRIDAYTMRCDLTDDMTMMHLALNDELHDLALIAIHDRDTNELTSLILNSDATTMIIL
jgi:hypothetical protein